MVKEQTEYSLLHIFVVLNVASNVIDYHSAMVERGRGEGGERELLTVIISVVMWNEW